MLRGILSVDYGQLNSAFGLIRRREGDRESKCVLVDTINKFSDLLHIAHLPYYGQPFVGFAGLSNH